MEFAADRSAVDAALVGLCDRALADLPEPVSLPDGLERTVAWMRGMSEQRAASGEQGNVSGQRAAGSVQEA